MTTEKITETPKETVNRVINEFGFGVLNNYIDLRNCSNGEVENFFQSLIKSEKVVFHGTNAEERFDSLEARQANDEAKESGNKKAVYATTTAKIPLALAILNKTYLRSKFRNFMTVWGDADGKMIFEFSPNVYELFKSGDHNLFSDGYVYVLDKSNFINAEDAGNEWHSEVNQKPLLTCRVSKKLADVIFVTGKGNKDNVREYSENKPRDVSNKLYHGSSHRVEGMLQPVLRHRTLDHVHTKPAVFATERMDVAALFMFPTDILASIGFEKDIAYVCIWGTPEEFLQKNKGSFVYVLSGENFEKIGKDYEWQSFEPVQPIEVREFKSAIDGMIECGVQVYFINDNKMFDRVVADKNNRAPILRELISENQRRNLKIRKFK